MSELVKKVDQLIVDINSELEYEKTQYTQLYQDTNSTKLIKLGMMLTQLRITSLRSGLGGKIIIDLEHQDVGTALVNNQFKTGDIVSIIGGSKDIVDVGGVILRVTEYKTVVALGQDTELETSIGLFKMKKLANEVTFKRMLTVLDTMKQVLENKPNKWLGNSALIPLLLSNSKSTCNLVTFSAIDDYQLFDPNLNESQQIAIRKALQCDSLFLIHGPPGTGKTFTLIELIRQLVAKDKKVLVCGPSNVAVDNILERLLPYNINCLRVGHPGRVKIPKLLDQVLDLKLRYSDEGKLVKDVRDEMDATLNQISKCKNRGERKLLYQEVKELRKEYRTRESNAITQLKSNAQVTLSTLNNCGSKQFYNSKFDYLIIDEATQALEPECYLAISKADKVVLAGDHHQLPPTVLSNNVRLQNTLFYQVLKNYGSEVCHMLNTQYRMHTKIMEFSAKILYDNKLLAHSSVAEHLLKDLPDVSEDPNTEVPLVFIDTAANSLLESTADDLSLANSKFNLGEVDLVANHLQQLVEAGVLPQQIAIISPYQGQVTRLKTTLLPTYPQLEIGSVDGFQGREKEVIILSLVRSNEKGEVGFLKDYRRLNVAITRAKRCLVVVGDSNTVFQPIIKDKIEYKEFLNKLGNYLDANAELVIPDF